MIDDENNELLLDARATEPIPPSRHTMLGSTMVEDCNETERQHVSTFLLDEAREYRESIESDPILHPDRVKFPQHEYGHRWTEAQLSAYGELVGLRIYQVNRTFTQDGSDVASRSETMVYEYSNPQNSKSTETAVGTGGALCL